MAERFVSCRLSGIGAGDADSRLLPLPLGSWEDGVVIGGLSVVDSAASLAPVVVALWFLGAE
jgi:hypothetical protein